MQGIHVGLKCMARRKVLFILACDKFRNPITLESAIIVGLGVGGLGVGGLGVGGLGVGGLREI